MWETDEQMHQADEGTEWQRNERTETRIYGENVLTIAHMCAGASPVALSYRSTAFVHDVGVVAPATLYLFEKIHAKHSSTQGPS